MLDTCMQFGTLTLTELHTLMAASLASKHGWPPAAVFLQSLEIERLQMTAVIAMNENNMQAPLPQLATLHPLHRE